MKRIEKEDFNRAAEKSVDFICKRINEQLENFCRGGGDIYDKYLYHCTLNAHRDNLEMFIRRSSMYIAESFYSDYVHPEDVDELVELVKKKLQGESLEGIKGGRECLAEDKYQYMYFFGPGTVKVMPGILNQMKELLKVGKIKIELKNIF